MAIAELKHQSLGVIVVHKPPRKGQAVYRGSMLIGTVDHLDGNICHFRDTNENTECFIWWFDSDNKPNELLHWE